MLGLLAAGVVAATFVQAVTSLLLARIIGLAGFAAACTVRPGPNPAGVELFALRRTEVSGDDSMSDFRLKLKGGFDAWHRPAQHLPAWRAAR